MLFLIAAAAAAAQPTSAYTDVNLDRCAIVAETEEGASVTWRCPGYRGFPLIVMAGDDRFDVDAGIDNGVWESSGEFSSPPTRVEWRLRGGRPFAIIYRLRLYQPEGATAYPEGSRLRLNDPEGAMSSVLVVETIGRPGAPGCAFFRVHGSVRNANAIARARADALASRFRCGRDHEEYEGPAY